MSPVSVEPDNALIARLATAERQCIVDWVQAIADLPGNPYRAEVKQFGQATATCCAAVPAEVINRVFDFTDADVEVIPDILNYYGNAGASPAFDIIPGTVTPFWEGPNVLLHLARHDLYQAGFHQMLYRPLSQVDGQPNPDIQIRTIGPADIATFNHLYSAVWGEPGVAAVWLTHPHFRCYVAAIDGADAGLGILHIAGDVASLANGMTMPAMRGAGVQSALIQHRVREAAAAGCTLLTGQSRPGTASQHNQMKAGLLLAATKVWWIPRVTTPG
jgi:GNAT superfamily N-acetyltransferase